MRYWTKELWAVRDDEADIVGALIIVLPMKDNTSLITPAIAVRPDARRRLDGSGTPAQALARGYGLQPANVEVHRILELPSTRRSSMVWRRRLLRSMGGTS